MLQYLVRTFCDCFEHASINNKWMLTFLMYKNQHSGVNWIPKIKMLITLDWKTTKTNCMNFCNQQSHFISYSDTICNKNKVVQVFCIGKSYSFLQKIKLNLWFSLHIYILHRKFDWKNWFAVFSRSFILYLGKEKRFKICHICVKRKPM